MITLSPSSARWVMKSGFEEQERAKEKARREKLPKRQRSSVWKKTRPPKRNSFLLALETVEELDAGEDTERLGETALTSLSSTAGDPEADAPTGFRQPSAAFPRFPPQKNGKSFRHRKPNRRRKRNRRPGWKSSGQAGPSPFLLKPGTL